MVRKIIHLHLHKTGGTSLNRWLDTLVPAARARPATRRLDIDPAAPVAGSLFDDRARMWASARMQMCAAVAIPGRQATLSPPHAMRQFVLFSERGRDARAYWDVIHDHCPAVTTADPSAYRVVVLRDPLERFLSFIRDWRRLSESDLSVLPPDAVALRRAARDSDADGVVQCAVETGLIASFTQSTPLVSAAIHSLSPDVLADCGTEPRALAMRALDSLFDLVGVAERLDDVARCIARDCGACPVDSLGRLNQGVADPTRDALSAESLVILEELFAVDRELHRKAGAMLRARLEPAYCEADFEARHLERRLEQLTPRFADGERMFSFNDAIVGSGFHGREAAETEQVTVWTGPGTRSVLYLPVPAHERLLISIDVGGSIHPSVGASLRIRVDGQARDFQRVSHGGGLERIVVPVQTTRPYCKVELLVDRTMTPAEAGLRDGDARRLGIALRGYGYTLAQTEGVVTRDVGDSPGRSPQDGGSVDSPTAEGNPDLPWARLVAEALLGHLSTQADPERLIDLLTWDVTAEALAAPPTAAGVEHAFRRLYRRPAPQAWLDFWVGRADTTLRHLYRDLVNGVRLGRGDDRLELPAR